mgnify:CR=1 FL=1
MADSTQIEWTDSTWNPVTGCTKVTAGCDFCYAERFSERFRGVPGHPFTNGFDLTLRPERLRQPLHWRQPRRIFVNSMSDLFHKGVPRHFIDAVFDTMEEADWHTYQVLTKRSSLMTRYLRARYGAGLGPAHIRLGVSGGDATNAVRLKHLKDARASIKFVSFEPLLDSVGPVDLSGIDWAIVGGESGPKARPMHPDWARSLRGQCKAAGVAFNFKQWGEWRPICQGACDWYQPLYKSNRIAHVDENQQALDDVFGKTCTVPQLCLRNDGQHAAIAEPGAWQEGTQPIHAFKVGKKRAGRLLDGVLHDAYPR